ncbi:MAG: hypothetical protein WBW33_29020 [Bryobacteraceae bacterium]
MLTDEWMGDVDAVLIFRASRSAASRVDDKLLCATAQKSNSAPVSNAHEEIQIQGERLWTGKKPATAAILVPEFDFAWSSADNLG